MGYYPRSVRFASDEGVISRYDMLIECRYRKGRSMNTVMEKSERAINKTLDLLYLVRHANMSKKVTSDNMVELDTVINHLRDMLNFPGLTRKQVNEVRQYYRPYKVSTFTHRFVLGITGNFRPDILPEEMHFAYIDPFYNDRKRSAGLENKCLFERLLPGIKQPDTILSRMNRFWYDKDGNMLSAEEVLEVVSSYNELFIKNADDSFGGSGVFKISASESESLKRSFIDSVKKQKGDLVVQLPLRQHPKLARINPHSVNTIRIISMLNKDGVKIYSSILRIGRGSSYLDNFTSGGLICGIDDNGRLRKQAYDNKKGYFTHPDTGVKFEGFPIPAYEDALEMVKKAHPMLPWFRLISWDICINEACEPVLVEANLTNGGINLHLITNGTLFGDDTRKIIKKALAHTDFPRTRS